MNNIDLNVQKWNDYSNIIPIQDICTSIKMNCSFKNITTELQFTVAYNYQDYYYFNFEIGDNVYLYVDGQFLFNGKITDSTFNLANNTQTFICYDLAWWVCKNNITKNFNGDMSIKEAIWYVFGMFNFTNFDVDVSELGKYADMKIGKHRIKNKSAKDVLLAILSDITRVTGIYYYIHMNTRGQVVITECDKYYSGLTIQKSSSDNVDGNLIDYTVTRSMQEMVNQYRIYDINYKEVLDKPLRPKNFTDDDKKRYGIIQETIMLNKDEDLNTAIEESEKEDADELTDNDQAKIVNNYNSKILKIKNQLELKGYPTTEVLVKCIGDINYKVGYGVMCKLPDSEFYDKFMYITASEFEFIPNSDYWINTLTLSTSKHQELTTWEDIEEVVTDENGNIIQGEGSTRGNSIVVKKALEWAYEIANDDNIGYSMNPNLRNGPDYYDCSAFVIHAYRNGGLSLSNATYTGNMYDTFLAEGFEDVTSQINLSTGEGLIAGDVLLNTIEHTEIYTGNGKKIGAHTDRYAKADQISENAYSNHPWNYVLRYIITEEKGKNESVSSDGSLDAVVNCTSQSEFSSMVAAYAKELYSKYHIFPGTIISCMIQESWTGSGFTKLAKNYYNFGGVKCSASSQNAVQDYKPPASEGSMLYRRFDSVKDFMIYWCELISGSSYNYKSAIADKNTPKEQIFGFDSTPYAGDKTKGTKMWAIYNQNNLSQYDNV